MAPNQNQNKNPSNAFRSRNELLKFPQNQPNLHLQHVGSGFQYPPYPINQGYPPNIPNQGYPPNGMNQMYPPRVMNQYHPPNAINQGQGGYPPNATNKMYPPSFTKPSLHSNVIKPNLYPNAGKKGPPTPINTEITSNENSQYTDDSDYSTQHDDDHEQEEEFGDEEEDATTTKAPIISNFGVTITAVMERIDAIVMKDLELQMVKEENKKLLQRKEFELQLAKEESKRFLQRNKLLKTLLVKGRLTPAEEAAKEMLLKKLSR